MLRDIKKALVVAAHPDDEVLGCGGTIAKMTANGTEVQTLILATGAASREDANNKLRKTAIEELKAGANKAADILGVAKVHFGEFPDNKMDSIPLLDIIKLIEALVNDFNPEIILTHHYGDLNIDHEITQRATFTACRPIPGSSINTILMFETVSSTEWPSFPHRAFQPNSYIDIENTFPIKQTALEAYMIEMRPSPHPRSFDQINHLACLRGAEIGIKAAEAFVISKLIIKD